MKHYTVIHAGIEHIMLIHDMAQVAFRHAYKEILSPEQIDYMMVWMYSPENLKRQMNDGHVYYIAISDDIPCGYLSVQYEGVSEDSCKLFHLHKIYVMPSEIGHGLGRILFEKALEHVRSLAGGTPARVELNVNRNNPAIGFYEHLGLHILRQGDFDIGNGFYMNDYIMGVELD